MVRTAVMLGTPATTCSMGMVTLRPISSAEMPGDWVSTSTSGGTGSG